MMTSSAPSLGNPRSERGQTAQRRRQQDSAQPKLATKLPAATQSCFLVPWSVWNDKTRKNPQLGGPTLSGRRIAIPKSQLRRLSIALRLPQILQSEDQYQKCTRDGTRDEDAGLDTRIWQNLPHDIIFNIINHLDLPDQIKWSCVSRDFFLLASSKIWSQLSICAEDIEAHCEPGHRLEPLNREKSIIQFLARAAYRKDPRVVFGRLDGFRSLDDPLHMYQPQTLGRFVNIAEMPAPLPAFHIKCLKVEQYRSQEARTSGRRVAPHVSDRALGVLLRCLPNLTDCLIKGHLYAFCFMHVLDVGRLTKLDIRSGLADEIFDKFAPNVWEWLVLDTGRLATLRNLTSLKIGCLLLQEAEGLARSVILLRLKHLEISCSRTTFDEAIHQWIYKPRTSASPLIRFLSSIIRPSAAEKQSSICGFPVTLETLSLYDEWHHQIPSLHQTIFKAIQPCQNLQRLLIGNRLDFERYKAMRGLPLYRATEALTLGSWQRLDSEAKIRWQFHYLTPNGQLQWTEVLPDPEAKLIGKLSKVLDSLLPDERSDVSIRKAILFLRSSGIPTRNVCVMPQNCEHETWSNSCFLCGQGYEYDGEEIENLIHQLRGWEIDDRQDRTERLMQIQAKRLEREARRP